MRTRALNGPEGDKDKGPSIVVHGNEKIENPSRWERRGTDTIIFLRRKNHKRDWLGRGKKWGVISCGWSSKASRKGKGMTGWGGHMKGNFELWQGQSRKRANLGEAGVKGQLWSVTKKKRKGKKTELRGGIGCHLHWELKPPLSKS